MVPSKPLARLSPAERLNFLLTNRLPRRWLTLFMGRFSKLENPLTARLSIALWQLLSTTFVSSRQRKAVSGVCTTALFVS